MSFYDKKKHLSIPACQNRLRIHLLGRPALAPVRILFRVILSLPPLEIIYLFFAVKIPIWGNFEPALDFFQIKSGANST